MTTGSALLVLALGSALVAVLVWGFRRASDGPEVTHGPEQAQPDQAESRHDVESR
jgi:hypothetical protein